MSAVKVDPRTGAPFESIEPPMSYWVGLMCRNYVLGTARSPHRSLSVATLAVEPVDPGRGRATGAVPGIMGAFIVFIMSSCSLIGLSC